MGCPSSYRHNTLLCTSRCSLFGLGFQFCPSRVCLVRLHRGSQSLRVRRAHIPSGGIAFGVEGSCGALIVAQMNPSGNKKLR